MCADHGPGELRLSKTRVALGFVLTPLFPALLVSAVLDNPIYLAVSVYFGYPGIVIFAIPAFFVVRRYTKINFATCLVCGVTLGLLESLIITILDGFRALDLSLVFGASFGLAFGLTFWLIAIAQWSDVLGSER